MANVFSREPIPKKLPKEMNAVISKLKKTKSKEECLLKAYDFLRKRYKGYRIRTIFSYHELLWKEFNRVWNRPGFQLCSNMNWALRILLIKSGKFKEQDIQLKVSMIYFISPHQYARVKLDDATWIDVDIWGANQGVPFGKHGQGFSYR
jgi:hypothetical protein